MNTGNKFIDSLSQTLAERVVGAGIYVTLPVKSTLYNTLKPLHYAYFPTSGLASVTVPLLGPPVEVRMIGCEGIVGSEGIWNSSLAPITQCHMQVVGTGVRVPLAELRIISGADPELRERIWTYQMTVLMATSSILACNAIHGVERRVARWLLTAFDHLDTGQMDITQDDIATKIGVRRTTVTMLMSKLRNTGAISATRGRIRITDRDALLQHACPCYAIMRDVLTDPMRSA